MGRGDKKTKRGKISMGSFGVSRPARKATATVAAAAPEKAPAKKKASTKAANSTEEPKAKKTAKSKSAE